VGNINPAIADLAVPVDDVLPYPGNARVHKMPTIVASLKANGQYKPIVAQRSTRFVLAGNGTHKGVRELGWSHVAVSWVDCDEQTALRILAVDNKASDDAGYDDEALAALLASIEDLAGSGWSQSEVDALLAAQLPRPALTDPDDAPDVPAESHTVSRKGDVWELGPHRLLCGDSTDLEAVQGMLGDERCDAMWTDPPYGVDYVGGTGLTIQNDGAEGLPSLLAGAFGVAARVLMPGAAVYVAHADTARVTFECALLEAGFLVRQNLVWVKNSLVLGRSDYHWRHEPILEASTRPIWHCTKDGRTEPCGACKACQDDARALLFAAWGHLESSDDHEPLLYGFAGGAKGRLGRGGPRWHGDNKQTTVFEVPKPPRNADHPTMKPVALITAQLSNSVGAGALVLDLFGGSGSTLIACHTLGMVARLVELDQRYADVICRRYQEHTGVVPKRDGVEVDFTAAVPA
jgi:site-specific DNA-methyltransferase (adenine-specific)